MAEMPRADFVVQGSSELVTCAGAAPFAGEDQASVGVVERGALAACRGEVVWVGPESSLDREVEVEPGAVRIDVQGRAVLPGFVDAHTHLVWGGSREDELAKRLAGATYSEIAAAGGGILRTVESTRYTSEDELAERAAQRMARIARTGTTSVEIKSGYGLSTDAELKLLRAARRAAERHALTTVRTFLGAHTFPAEARRSRTARDAYLAEVCETMIPRVVEEKLARFADVFIDEHAFTEDEARRVLSTARDAGLELKVHALQLAHDGGGRLAAELGATSVDHLEFAEDDDLDALAEAGTVGVLLPGATLFLQMDTWAPGRRMVERRVPVALATDLNPGSCPSESMALMMQLACLRCGLSIDEAIVAATANAAAACGLQDRVGSLEPGKRCDVLVVDGTSRAELIYALGSQRTHMVIAGGRIIA